MNYLKIISRSTLIIERLFIRSNLNVKMIQLRKHFNIKLFLKNGLNFILRYKSRI